MFCFELFNLKMTVFFQTGKFSFIRKCLNAPICNSIFLRNYSDPVKKFKSFSDVIAERKAEARRSLVVQVNSDTSFNELYGYCSKYASIKDIHHYRNSEKEHFMLIEFETEDNVKEVLKACSSHQKDVDVMAIESPFLWFRAAVNKKEKYSCPSTKKLTIKDGIEPVDDDVLYDELLNCETVTQQIQHLYERTKLNDLGVRLRFMVARQFELIFKSLYANVEVQPFGSSVNGCGRMGCDLDLVLSNVVTEEMSDPRRRLVYQENWASAAGLTSPHPGRWITNFPLTLMVLFFLQQKRKTGFVLPPLKVLVDRAGKEDIRIAEENINCTFLRDLNKLPQEEYGQCSEDLHTLLLQFFEFYAQFDFQEHAISINRGVPIRKPNALPLYIVNPLDQAMNVSRNVSYEECERLRLEVRNAAWILEEGLEGKKGDDWGVLRLIERKDSRGLKQLLRVGNSHRLVSVKDLFREDDEDVPVAKSKKTDEEMDKNVKEMSRVNVEKKEQKIKFKNSQIASEVFRIRRNKIV
ncbi:PREDICTED: poly(A) RNA polymerase, mitochondrial [Papilio polytes]|uniref:poly(A) RNA polymerase, mitochondrial n=1 Tax=Papilio polytes TaxID=76194 RepID=UPI000675E08A|nr:PREDICTED: poly(A) RNA polymerase, mitochondrial [Papilio polytes]